jgi:tetratricopeptide (TPR) repeat protein
MVQLTDFANSDFGKSTFGPSSFGKSKFGAHETEADFTELTALVIDPAPMTRSILVSQVREFGFRNVSQCARLSDALAKFNNNEIFDVILCEHSFVNERTCAIDMVDDLRAKQLLPLSTMVFLITGEASYSKVAEAAESGLDAYLLKPHNANMLHERLRLCQMRKRALSEIYAAISAKNYGFAADLCLERYTFRSQFWLYAARIGAELLMRVKRFKEAESLYQAIADAQAMPWAKLGVARAQLDTGQVVEATTTLSALIEDDPHYSDAYDVMARAQFELGDLQRARSTYAMACRMTPDSVSRSQNFGMLLFYAGDIDQAREFLDRSVRLGRDSKLFDCQTLVGLGFASLHGSDRRALQRCVDDMGRLLAKNKDSTRLQRNLGVLNMLICLLNGDEKNFRSGLDTILPLIKAPEFEFEAAANAISLLTYASRFQIKIDHPHTYLTDIAMRFSTNRSLTDILAGAAFEVQTYADLIRQSGQNVQVISQNCLSISMRGNPGSAIRQLLAEGEKTCNSKLIESAVQLVVRYRDKIADASALELRAESLRHRFCKFSTKRSADFVSSPSARTAGELVLRA